MTDTVSTNPTDQPEVQEPAPALTVEQELHTLRTSRLANRVLELPLGDPAHVAVVNVVQDILLRTEGI